VAVLYSKGYPLNSLDDGWNGRFFDLYEHIKKVL
jgi:hypothetical protein